MRPIGDIKAVLFIAYAYAYPLAVLPAALIDPLLLTHSTFPLRTYDHLRFCYLIYATLLVAQFVLLWSATKLWQLYTSVCIFLASIIVSLPIFLPEFPHANVAAVGIGTSFFSLVSIFVWSIAKQISIDDDELRSAGSAIFEYMKVLFTFVRQAAFACVALFGALFLAAYATGFKFVDVTAKDDSDRYLLYLNTGFQVSFYGVYALLGPVRYFFVMNLQVLLQFKRTAIRIDADDDESG